MKVFLVCVVLALATRSSHSFFLHKKVVEIPVHLQPVHVQPVLIEKPQVHHIDPPVVTSTAAPSKSHTDQLQQVWNHVKSSVGNHKFIRHFYQQKPAEHVSEIAPPQFDILPSLGFSHYKKVNYIPILPTPAPIPSHVEFEYIPDFTHPFYPEVPTFPETPVIPEFPKKPSDFESSVSGNQNKQLVSPAIVSEQSNVKTVPSVPVIPTPPSIQYGLPPVF